MCEQSRWFRWWPLWDVLLVGKATSQAQRTRGTNFKGVGVFFLFFSKKQEESHTRKRTIWQGQISQRRGSKIPFMEHTPETKRRKEERRASGEATIREDSSREERRRQDKRKQETRGEDERLHQKRQSEKRASRVFPTVPQAHREKLFPSSSPLLGASCLFPFFFSPGCLLLVLCLGLS